jgi:hypothetical protein
MIAVVVLLLGIDAKAGTIAQSVNFFFAENGTNFRHYNQLDPSLAPLNDVTTLVNVFGTGNGYLLTNPTLNTITFNATLSWMLDVDGGASLSSVSTVPVTLLPGHLIHFIPFSVFSSPGYQFFTIQTTNLDVYIGTGTLGPFQFGGFRDNVTTDNSSITIELRLQDRMLSGTETVTYYYGNTVFVPEPTSLAMLSLGLATIAGLAWRRRKVRLAG